MINKKKILAVTLARGGSKAVPKKNIRELGGLPLIVHTIKAAQQSSVIDHYIISTDCETTAQICRDYGANIPFLRPEKYSTDTASSAEALLHSVHHMESLGQTFDYVVELMATNPFKTTAQIDACIKQTIDGGHDCGVAVHQLWDQHPSRVKMIVDGVLQDFYPEIPESRRQDLTPPAFIRSGSIYVTSINFLKAYRSRYGKNNTYAFIMDPKTVVNIDEEADFTAAEMRYSEKL